MNFYLAMTLGWIITGVVGWGTHRMFRKDVRRHYWQKARKDVEGRHMIEFWQNYERENGFK